MMQDEKDLIRIQWHVDRIGENPVFMLLCQDPGHPELQVSAEASDSLTERRAKAILMQQMYELGKQHGIPPQRLRFKINGIEE